MKLDLFDMIALMGLSMMFVGLWWLSPPVALIITGALLVGFGVWGAGRRRASARAGKRVIEVNGYVESAMGAQNEPDQ